MKVLSPYLSLKVPAKSTRWWSREILPSTLLKLKLEVMIVMSQARCPNCKKRHDLGSRVFAPGDQCHCPQRNDLLGVILEIASWPAWPLAAFGNDKMVIGDDDLQDVMNNSKK